MNLNSPTKLVLIGAAALRLCAPARALEVYLNDVPDYGWVYSCMGTAAGNLMGFWDRNGFPDFYTGQVRGGLAPLTMSGPAISSMWASCAGMDGRPPDRPGHIEDYYDNFESTAPDPYLALGRPEHAPDCLSDFMGMDQLKWTNMAGECDGNVDGYCFVYWDTNGERRVNYVPHDDTGQAVPDVQSGLRAWTQYRGYDCVVFTQLADFNPQTPAGKGFKFADLVAEIEAGYPVLLFLQSYNQYSVARDSLARANPEIHAMLAFGYMQNGSTQVVRYVTSWAQGPKLSSWAAINWQVDLPLRGVIGFRPLPKIRKATFDQGHLSLKWDGPAATVYRSPPGTSPRVHGYVVEVATNLATGEFTAVSPVLLTNVYTLSNCPSPAFCRLKLVKP